MAKDSYDAQQVREGSSFKWQVIEKARSHGQNEYRIFRLFERGDDLAFYKCFWCYQWFQSEGIDGDHIKERRNGGSDDPSNLCVACTSCNRSSRNIKSDSKNRQWYKNQKHIGRQACQLAGHKDIDSLLAYIYSNKFTFVVTAINHTITQYRHRPAKFT